MLAIDIGYAEENDEKVHHKKTNLISYFILLLLIKLSYFIYFYIVDNPDKTSWLLIIFYYLSLILFFLLSCLLMINQKRRTIYDIHWTMLLWGSEFISYFIIILNYFLVNRSFQIENIYYYIAGIEILCLLLLNIFMNCHSLYLTLKKRGRICYHIIIFSIFIILSLVIHLYAIKTTYEIANKNVTKM